MFEGGLLCRLHTYEVPARCALDTAGVGVTISQCWIMVSNNVDHGPYFSVVRTSLIDFDSALLDMLVELWSKKLATFTPPI